MVTAHPHLAQPAPNSRGAGKRRLFTVWILLCVSVFPSFIHSEELTESQQRTLATLKRIDDFPLYEMHYYGDYGFDQFLQAKSQFGNRPASGEFSAQESLNRWACTCFVALRNAQKPVFGRNFDWYQHPALILFTDPPNAYASVSMVDISYLGFDRQAPSERHKRRLLEAPYLPFDGMNEYGLVVGMMAVLFADGGHDPQKMTLNSLQAIRLLLDYAQNVDEALTLLQQYNIDFTGGPPLHYLIADSTGHSAVVEFTTGHMSILRNTRPWQVATNFVIAGTTPERARSQCWRYRSASETLERMDGELSPQEAMALLKNVSQESTIWSAVYGMTGGNVRIVMGRNYDTIYEFSLK